MSLINCPECNRQVSDQANSCPNCGFQIANYFNQKERELKQIEQQEKLNKRNRKKVHKNAEEGFRICGYDLLLSDRTRNG